MILFCAKIFAQNIKDTIFQNVIKVDDKYMFSNSHMFPKFRDKNADILIDIAIPSSHKKPILFITAEISLKRLQYIYPEFSEIIIITPNHHYYRNISKLREEPTPSSVLYDIKRTENEVKIDSLVIKNGFPNMSFYENQLIGNYKEDFEYHQKEIGKIKVFYQDKENLNPENEITTLKNSISEYEKRFKKKIHYFKKYNKKYRIFENYYTLEGLTKQEKLEFILHRRWAVIPNKSAKDLYFAPLIITPFWVKTDKKNAK